MQHSIDEIKKELQNWPKIVRKYHQENKKKAIFQIITSFLPFLAIWILMYFTIGISYWITLGLALLNGFFLVRIFIIQHDCGHQSFFKNKKVNNILGSVCSVFSMLPYTYWARTHQFHHSHNAQLEYRDIGDINTLTVKEFQALSRTQKLFYRIYRSPIFMFIIGPIYYIFIHNRLPLINLKGWKKEKISLIQHNFLFLGIYTLVALLVGWKLFLMIQIPILVFFGVIAIWFFYIQHQFEYSYKQWKNNWDYLLSAIQGSSYYKLPKIMHWLSGNIGYHHIHHLSHKIPSYNLVKCSKENPVFQKYVTSMTFFSSLKCAFYKLWDEERQKMISFTEYYRMSRKNELQF